MVKVLILRMDGYSGWTPEGEEIVELPDFSEKTICELETDGEFSTFQELKDLRFKISCLNHSVTINREEGGNIYIPKAWFIPV